MFQVIRRGDRRPFYAPARYVIEMKEEQDWDSVWMGDAVHYRSDNGEPIPSRMEPYHDRKGQFSTFLNPLTLNNGNKRSSYAPPPSQTGQGPQSSDFLFGVPRFQERYRSNSMDSILVQDMSRQVFHQFQPEKIPHGIRHYPHPPHGPPLLIPTQGPVGLEKRPTFDNIDKRASWSAEKGGLYHQPFPGPVLVKPANVLQPKKPIPLPRSKIPLPTKAATIERAAPQQDMKTFKRSKTDLSLNMLSSYKAGRGMTGGSGSNRVSPLNFMKTNSSNSGGNKQKSAQLRSRPSNRSNRPAVISEESPRSLSNDYKQPDSLVINEKHLFNKYKMNSKKVDNKSNVNSKPAIREKPSLVNHNRSAANLIDKKTNANPVISRHRSESDLLKIEPWTQTESNLNLMVDNIQPSNLLPTPGETKVEQSDMRISLKVDAKLDKRRSTENLIKKAESKENLSSTKATPVLSSSDKKTNSRKVTNEKFLDMDELPEPPPTPPTPPDFLKSMEELSGTSKPLIISTEPMSVSSCSNNKSEDKSNCSSYDSLDGSLDSTASTEWPEGGEWLGTEPTRDLVKSPNNSTCSRSPPTPPPSSSPVRQVMADWDEFLDVSGRKYYYNSKTHEKSWKPPRKPRGSEGNSAPTSPGPNQDQTFDMITDFQAENKEPEPEVSVATEAAAETDTVQPEVVLDNENSGDVENVTEEIPSGYEVKYETEDGELYYVNVFTGVAWYTAKDKYGRTYYYEENGNESCWTLPSVSQTIQDHSVNPSPVPEKLEKEFTHLPNKKLHAKDEDFESTKTDSFRRKFLHSNSCHQIGDLRFNIIKQGLFHKTKIIENGKKCRKNWTISNVVLSDGFLLYFKDTKSFLEKGNKPDHSVDLKGANIEWCNSDKSKRQNVFEVSTEF